MKQTLDNFIRSEDNIYFWEIVRATAGWSDISSRYSRFGIRKDGEVLSTRYDLLFAAAAVLNETDL